MKVLFDNKLVAGALALAAILVGVVVFFASHTKAPEEPVVVEPVIEATPEPIVTKPVHEIIGSSVEGRALESYTYGTGDTELLFVGGVHGGYEWNSVYLAYRFMDYLYANPGTIPANLSVTVIPSANPDGVFEVVGVEGRFAVEDTPDAVSSSGTGRFNAHDVDLNRNFDCKWKPESQWRGSTVSAGTSPFSEPEAVALRDYVIAHKPVAVVFWHSQSNTVYASECTAGILPETLVLMNTYAHAAGYSAVEKFDAYEVTGDAEGWLASINIPAITVELKTHEIIEWDKNLAGIKALFASYGKDTGLSR